MNSRPFTESKILHQLLQKTNIWPCCAGVCGYGEGVHTGLNS